MESSQTQSRCRGEKETFSKNTDRVDRSQKIDKARSSYATENHSRGGKDAPSRDSVSSVSWRKSHAEWRRRADGGQRAGGSENQPGSPGGSSGPL